MSRANPRAVISTEEQLVPSANRCKITKNNQRVASDTNITDTMLRFVVGILRHHKLYKSVSLNATVPGIVHSANLDFASLIWDEFEWQVVDRITKPTKMSKLMYTRFTKLIIDHFLSCNKSIPRRSDFDMHSGGQDLPFTKLTNTIKGNYIFGMEIPDTMIDDAFKKSTGYKYYRAKKAKSKKAKADEELKEQHVSPVKMAYWCSNLWVGYRPWDPNLNIYRLYGVFDNYVIAAELSNNSLANALVILDSLPARSQRRSVCRIFPVETRVRDVEDTYVEWGQKCKDLVVEDPNAQLLLDLRKGSKASMLESLKQAKQAVEGEGSIEPKGDDDVAVLLKSTYLSLRVTTSSLEYIQTLLNDPPTNKLMDFMSNPVYTDAQITSAVIYLEGNPELTISISSASEVPPGSPIDREWDKRKKRQKDAGQSSTRSLRKDKTPIVYAQEDTYADQPQDQEDLYVQERPNAGWFMKKLGLANAIRRTTWSDLLLKSNIDQNEDHILGPSTVAIAKKLKGII
ncbi:hypothetical protein Tco_0268890 [Tanacetum coccineum]